TIPPVAAEAACRDAIDSRVIAKLLRKEGEFLLYRGDSTAARDAEKCFTQALTWARRQSALWWELGSATSLARLYQRQGSSARARNVLAPVYQQLTKGSALPMSSPQGPSSNH